MARLIADKSGNLYGTTSQGGSFAGQSLAGTAFELTPPTVSGGAWGETILWDFGNSLTEDGFDPAAPLLMDSSGNLFGTTLRGGLYGWGSGAGGTLFELPAGGAAAE